MRRHISTSSKYFYETFVEESHVFEGFAADHHEAAREPIALEAVGNGVFAVEIIVKRLLEESAHAQASSGDHRQ